MAKTERIQIRLLEEADKIWLEQKNARTGISVSTIAGGIIREARLAEEASAKKARK